MMEQVVVHKIAITLGMVRGQTQIFIQIKGCNLGKIQIALLVLFDQILIGADGCGTGSQTKDTIGLQNHLCGDDIGSLAAQFFIAGNVDDIHKKDLSWKNNKIIKIF